MPEHTRSAFDSAALARDAQAHGLVVLAGAGLSMGPPSSLPGWTDINNAFLDNLGMVISKHTSDETGLVVSEFVLERRETAGVAQPDLQAQLAEESLGGHYFALFKPLDIGTWNDGHAALAELAATGLVRAIVTTNFDRLIELALDATGVKPRVYCAPADFERLAEDLAAAPAAGTIPVIKVHGSVDRTDTMVDTLRQRVIGRPQTLEAALVRLLREHAVLVVGFSGADLAYDPRYLGLGEGAAGSPSFTVVNRPGSEPHAAMASMLASAGPQARVVDGTLPDGLVETARALGRTGTLAQPRFDVEMEYPGTRRALLSTKVQKAWAESLSPVRATVVLASIARAAGSHDAAFKLLMRTMPHHFKAKLAGDPALPAQLRMIASTLIESCHVEDELSRDAFTGSAALSVLALSLDGKSQALLDAEGLALRSLGFALCGFAPESDAVGIAALRASREDFRPIVRADTICVLARTWSLTERWIPAWIEALRQCYQMVFDWGDEPRRARVGALLGRFLIETGQLEGAARILVDCQRVDRRLNLAFTGNDLVATGGRLYLAEGRSDKAFSALLSACRHYESAQRNLSLAETLLPLSEAAVATGNIEVLRQATDRFAELLPLVPGMALPHAASQVRMYCSAGAFDLARGAVADLEAVGERWGGNQWIGDLASRLQQRIGTTETSRGR